MSTTGARSVDRIRHGAAVCIAIGVGVSVFGHVDDPKASSRAQRYDGPSWRRALDGGMRQGGGFESDDVQLESWITIGDFAGSHGNANDIWGYVSPSGREYALLGLECGLGVVEVTDPSNAQIVATVAGTCSLWGDVKVYGQYAYKVTESTGIGIQVIDLGDVDNGNVTVANEINDGPGNKSHNVVVDSRSGFLYRVGGSFYGFGVYDLNVDPVDPPLVGSWSDRYIHDAQVVTYGGGPYGGRQVMFANSGNNGGWENQRLEVIDVTGKADVFTVSEVFYSNTAYSHQGWLSDDRQYLYLNDELDERDLGTETTTRIINVADLENPFEVGTFGNGLSTIDHNLFVKGDLIFEANYAAGLRVFDKSDPEAPVEVAYFDTRPEDNGTNFNGLWGNYPYLPSGTILGSDRQRGLFVLTVYLVQTECTGDLDGSGGVDIGDLLAVLAAWGQRGGVEDLDGNGRVDFGDIQVLLANWGPCP